MLSKKVLSVLLIVLGGVSVCTFLLYGMFWSVERNQELSVSLDRVGRKADGADSALEGALQPLLDEQHKQKVRLDYLERFLFLPTDERGRRIVTVPDLRSALELRGWNWAGQWTAGQWDEASASRKEVNPSLPNKYYRLTVPHNSAWGDAEYAIAPYEFDGEDVLFGRISISELRGVVREARFSVAPKQSLEEVMADPKNRSFACSTEMQEVRPTIVTIGSRQVVRILWETCEFARITYIISGKDRNYVFETTIDETLLEWVIERFEEV